MSDSSIKNHNDASSDLSDNPNDSDFEPSTEMVH